MVFYQEFTLQTTQYNEMILITGQVEALVEKSGIRTGQVTVLTMHTTSGVAVNEALECLESDIDEFLRRIIPEDFPYSHARMLREYGSTAGNPTGHLKSHITGNHCHFPIVDGKMVRGGAQEIYFMEFDGPACRTVCVSVMGE